MQKQIDDLQDQLSKAYEQIDQLVEKNTELVNKRTALVSTMQKSEINKSKVAEEDSQVIAELRKINEQLTRELE